MKYFKVTAKCGHVGGTHKYIPIDFYTAAETASQAAGFVRNAPRVKHHRKDAIISICEISYEDYVAGAMRMASDPFLTCKSKQQQARYAEEIENRVLDEAEGRYQPWHDKYAGKKTQNRKKSLRYGYKNDYLLVTQGSFDYREYLFEDMPESIVA